MRFIIRGFWYYVGLTTSLLFKLVFLKTKVYYEDPSEQNKTIKGKAIIISNHRNPMDGLVIAYKYFFRRINYIAADFFKGAKRFMLPFVRITGAVILDRDTIDYNFFEESKRLLNKGKLVLVFPEGRMAHDYEPINFVYSYVALSIQSGAKIVPVVSDFNYTPFGRVRIIVGNSIEPSLHVATGEMTKEKLKEINANIRSHFIQLYYRLKKEKYDRFKSKYAATSPKPGDMIRIHVGTHYHYGVYLGNGEVTQFGRAVNKPGEEITVNMVTLKEFCGDKIPEIRILTRRQTKHRRKTEDIIKYAHQSLGQQGYNLSTNNCADYANRTVFK